MMGVVVRERRAVAGWALVAAVATATAATTAGDGLAVATLFAAGSTRRLRGVTGLLTGIVVGAALGAGIGYAAVAVGGLALSTLGAVGLGVALGGGIGVVTNYVATGEEGESGETVTVERDPEPASPTPADLFDDHPDPVLFVVDEGHGPVVRAANAAYGDTFDVPTDAVIGAGLEDAVLAGERTDDVVAAVADGESLDTVVTCEAADGERSFRLRTAGTGANGYLVYTPTE